MKTSPNNIKLQHKAFNFLYLEEIDSINKKTITKKKKIIPSY